MALKARITAEELAKLPEPLKSEYTPEKIRVKDRDGAEQLVPSGKFVPDVTPDGGFSLHDSSGLKIALEAERGYVTDLKTKLAPFEGLDAAEAREAVKNKETLKGGVNERITAVETKFKAEADAAKAAHDKEQARLLGYIKRTRAEAEIKAANGNPALLAPVVLPKVGIAPAGEDFNVFIADEKGAPITTKTAGSAGPMSIAEHLAELRGHDAFKSAFFADVKPGTGSPVGGAGGGGGGGTKSVGRNDLKAVGASIEAIGEGKVTVN